jgi:hypothetical protein
VSTSRQSWPSATVDVSIVAAVVGLSLIPSVSPLAWSVLTQIALVRFGVSMARQAFSGSGNGSGNGNGPSSDQRTDRRRDDRPTDDRDARRVTLEPAILAAIVCVAAIASACR